MALEIRKATMDDKASTVLLIALMHGESPRFGKYPFALKKAIALFELMVEHCGMFLAEQDGQTIGFFAGAVTEHLLSYEKCASDVGVFVRKEHRGGSAFVRLVKAFEQWAKEQGADEIALGVSTEVNADQTVRMYERLGYRISSYGLIKTGVK